MNRNSARFCFLLPHNINYGFGSIIVFRAPMGAASFFSLSACFLYQIVHCVQRPIVSELRSNYSVKKEKLYTDPSLSTIELKKLNSEPKLWIYWKDCKSDHKTCHRVVKNYSQIALASKSKKFGGSYLWKFSMTSIGFHVMGLIRKPIFPSLKAKALKSKEKI